MPSRYELAVRKSSPLYYWRFDRDQGGQLRNETVSDFNDEINLYGSLSYTTGPDLGTGKNVALHLSGHKEDYAVLRRCTDEADNADSFSIAMWIYPETLTSQDRIIYVNPNPNKTSQPGEPGYGNRCTLSIRGNNRFGFMVVCPEQTSGRAGKSVTYSVVSKPVQLNAWHHVVVTYTNSDRMNLYVDGQLEASKPLSSDVEKIGLNGREIYWCLGSRVWGGLQDETGNELQSDFFTGSVDEISQYNRELSAQDVRLLYQAALQK